jgi:hypothetical protein
MTGAAAKLAARAEDLPEGSVRRRLLEGARRFKAAWMEFGRLLSGVKREGLWREWGYPTFEAYCSKELFIRPATAEKLTQSFGFLERHEPELARSRGEPRAPPFEVVEVLSRAEAAGRLSQAGWRELRDDVLDGPATPASVARCIAERFGPPPAPPAPAKPERLARIAALARRLAGACEGESAMPRAVAQRAADLARELDALARRS